jgi:hypothetical protein
VFSMLSEVQLSQLTAANPFLDADAYIFLDDYLVNAVELTTDEIFPKLLEYSTLSLGVLQYILEEPDETLLNMYPFKSGSVAPVANISTLLEKAETSSKVVAGVVVTNYSGAAQGIALYHVVDGAASVPFDADAILYIPSPGVPNGTTPLKINLQLRPGDELRCLSTAGNCGFVSYITV